MILDQLQQQYKNESDAKNAQVCKNLEKILLKIHLSF